MRKTSHHDRLRAQARKAMADAERARQDLQVLGYVAAGLALVTIALITTLA